MSTNKDTPKNGAITEREVLARMADMKKPEGGADALKNFMLNNTGKGGDAVKEAKAATSAEPAKTADAEKIETTKAFAGDAAPGETDAPKAGKELVTKDTEGVYDWVEYGETPATQMPDEDGKRAQSPFVTYKKSHTLGKVVVESMYGRFHSNNKGEDKIFDMTWVDRVDPIQLGTAEGTVQQKFTEISEYVQNTVSQTSKLLRTFMTKHSYYMAPITDKNIAPTLRLQKKTNADKAVTIGYKVAESGVGPMAAHVMAVPVRGWECFAQGQQEDPEIVKSIVDEENPEMKCVIVQKDNLNWMIGSRFADIVNVLPELSDPTTSNKRISKDPSKGVVEGIKLTMRANTLFDPSDMSEAAVAKRERRDKKMSALRKAQDNIGAVLTMQFKPVNTARRTIVNPINFVPKRTYVTTRAGRSFKEAEGSSAAEMNALYLGTPLKKGVGANITLDSLYSAIMQPDDAHPFNFVPAIGESTIEKSPLFNYNGEELYVEPYFAEMVSDGADGFKCKKQRTTAVTRIAKREINPKTGATSFVFGHISDTSPESQYDTKYLTNVTFKVEGATSVPGLKFPTREEIVRAVTVEKTTSERKKAVNPNNLESAFSTFEIAAVMADGAPVIQQYLQAKDRISKIKKGDSKVQMWSGDYNASRKKAVRSVLLAPGAVNA